MLNRLFMMKSLDYSKETDPDFHFNHESHQLFFILFESYREDDLELRILRLLDYLQDDQLKRKWQKFS